MKQMTGLTVIWVLGLSMAAAGFDLRKGLIPNAITFPSLILGIAFHSATNGWNGLVFSLLGATAAVLVPLLLFCRNAMGGGDVKLLAATGAFLGAGPGLWLEFWAFIAASVWGLGVLSRRHGPPSARICFGPFVLAAAIFMTAAPGLRFF